MPDQPQANLEVWDELDIEPAFTPRVAELAGRAVPLPEVGIDLPDARGHTSGLEGELVWEDLEVAVAESLGDAERPVAADWSAFELDALLADIEPLVAALAHAPGDTCWPSKTPSASRSTTSSSTPSP